MDPKERLRRAIEAEASVGNLFHVAETFKGEGLSKEQITEVFESFRAIHENDPDETIYDNILDTMDFIVGWCRPDKALFPPDPS